MSALASSGVSIVIPTFNRAGVIERAVRSALEQRPAPDEVWVVDDGSTDETQAIVSAYGGHVRLHRQSNAGVSAARNAGVRELAGIATPELDRNGLLHRVEP